LLTHAAKQEMAFEVRGREGNTKDTKLSSIDGQSPIFHAMGFFLSHTATMPPAAH